MINLEILLTIFLVRGLIVFIIVGILIYELFNNRRENRFDIFLLLLIALSWIVSIGLGDYEFFTGKFPILLSWVVIFLLAFAVSTFIYLLIIKSLNFINKILAFPTAILAFALLVFSIINRYNYYPQVIPLAIFTSLVVTILGVFTFIDFLIKTSNGYKPKKKKWLSISRKVSLRTIGIIATVGSIFLLSFLAFAGGATFPLTEQQVNLSGELNIYNFLDDDLLDLNLNTKFLFDELGFLEYQSDYEEFDKIMKLKKEVWEELMK